MSSLYKYNSARECLIYDEGTRLLPQPSCRAEVREIGSDPWSVG